MSPILEILHFGRMQTFCGLAGVSTHDEKAAAAGLPPVDSLDLWPLVSGQNSTSPRDVIALGSPPVNFDGTASIAPITGLIKGQWKILIGRVAQAYWYVQCLCNRHILHYSY